MTRSNYKLLIIFGTIIICLAVGLMQNFDNLSARFKNNSAASLVLVAENNISQIESASNRPVILKVTVNPIKVKVGDMLTLTAEIKDENGVSEASAIMPFDGGNDEVQLYLISGDKKLGVWRGEWRVHNTTNIRYVSEISAVNALGFSSVAEVEWWDDTETKWLSGWSYRKMITVQNATSTLTNYQMQLIVNLGSGTDDINATTSKVYLNSHGQSDFDDIRFTASDGFTLLDYWREATTTATSSVWVEFNSLAATPTLSYFYMYYGNNTAGSAGNGSSTFILFDNFSDNNYTSNPTWTVVTGGWTAASGYLASASSTTPAEITSLLNSTTFRLRGRAKLSATSRALILGVEFGTRNTSYAMYYGANTNKITLWKNAATKIIDTAFTIDANAHVLMLTRDTNSLFNMYVDDINKGSITNSTTTSFDRVEFESHGSTNQILYWMFLANFTTNEPKWKTWGNEESIFKSPGISPSGGGLLIF